MKTRATVTIEPALHRRAKRLAMERRTSVSGLFEAMIKEQPEASPSIVDQMLGKSSLKSGKANDSRRQALEAKYLKR